MAVISKHSIEKVKSELKALERSGADSLQVSADLNRAMWRAIVDSIMAEQKGQKDLSEDELIKLCRRLALLGRRDTLTL